MYTRSKRYTQCHVSGKYLFTEMFWIVDGDAEVDPDFNFDYVMEDTRSPVWRSLNHK